MLVGLDPFLEQGIHLFIRDAPQLEARVPRFLARGEVVFHAYVNGRRVDEAARQIHEGRGGLPVLLERRRNPRLESGADAVKIRVFVQRRLDASHNAIQVGLFEQRGVDGELLAILLRQGLAPERGLAVGHDLSKAILRLGQREQRGIHEVIAVEIRVEDEVRHIPRVGDHDPDIRDQLRVPCGGFRRSQAREAHQLPPFLQHRAGAVVGTFALGQPLLRELEHGAELGVHRQQRLKRRFDRGLFRGERFLRLRLPCHRLHRKLAVLRNEFEQLLQRALILVPLLLHARELDVRVDARDEEIEHHGIRHHEEDADEHQLLRNLELVEPLSHCGPLRWNQERRGLIISVEIRNNPNRTKHTPCRRRRKTTRRDSIAPAQMGGAATLATKVKDSRPPVPVQRAILDGLARMRGLNRFLAFQVGDGARHFQDAVVSPALNPADPRARRSLALSGGMLPSGLG